MKERKTSLMNVKLNQSVILKLSKLQANKGQINGLPKNPRIIKDDKFKKLVKSIEDNPEMTSLREILVYPCGDKYVVIGGNMRLKALKELGYKEAPCKIIPEETTVEQLKAYTIKDNSGFGEWDFGINSDKWDIDLLDICDIELPSIDFNSPDNIEDPYEEKDSDDNEKLERDTFEDMMVKDCLFDSNNDFEIPNLLLSEQAGKLELPLSTWGANTRLSKDVTTYHFYVDDYRFNAIWKDPTNLLTSGCKAIVEPNCSLHDQTPISFGLHLIYKKRWIARYCQECGIKVYADLNVAQKFVEYNKMGIPKGYNAFFTRGLDGWMESLKSDLEVAREISGLQTPNLIVYGGGKEIKEFCQNNNLLYITDFINAKKLN